jgi:hypothetical protein
MLRSRPDYFSARTRGSRWSPATVSGSSTQMRKIAIAFNSPGASGKAPGAKTERPTEQSGDALRELKSGMALDDPGGAPTEEPSGRDAVRIVVSGDNSLSTALRSAPNSTTKPADKPTTRLTARRAETTTRLTASIACPTSSSLETASCSQRSAGICALGISSLTSNPIMEDNATFQASKNCCKIATGPSGSQLPGGNTRTCRIGTHTRLAIST